MALIRIFAIMPNWTHFYLIRISFLGFRYHGWQKQEGLKTVHLMVDKTLKFILGDQPFRSLGCGRTDAMVSAEDYAFELFTTAALDKDKIVHQLNKNFPPDIYAKSASAVDGSFNIIQHAKVKAYHYHFCFGEKPHPFSAPFVQHLGKKLNVSLMMEAATLFEGTHHFRSFTSKPNEDAQFDRNILQALIVPMDSVSAKVDDHFVFQAVAKGFLRYQVRMMMGALIEIGKGMITTDHLKEMLKGQSAYQLRTVAPGSGLRLHQVTFE